MGSGALGGRSVSYRVQRVSCLSSGVRQTLGGQRGVGWSRRSSEAMAWQAGSRVDEVLKR